MHVFQQGSSRSNVLSFCAQRGGGVIVKKIRKKKRFPWEASGVTLGNVCRPTHLFHLDGVFLAAFEILSFPRGIVAVAVVTDSNGASKEARGPAEVAGAAVGDVVIATDLLLRWHRYRARGCAAHDTVSTVGLVSHTGVGTGAHHVGA